MSQTFDYQVTASSGLVADITVTAAATLSAGTGTTFTGEGYDILSISGTIDLGDGNGPQTITGEAGTSGNVQASADGGTYVNMVFPDASSGGVFTDGGTTYTGSTLGLDTYGIEFSTSNDEFNLYEWGDSIHLGDIGANTDIPVTVTSPDAPCFRAGTAIATPEGETAVETLKIGDMVLTAQGDAVPVRWLGVRQVDLRFSDPVRNQPVRIMAGALGNGLPRRDLLVSPDHALYLGGVLVQAGALVNGVSIVRAAMPAKFSYYHIETAAHTLILAEGAPAETFIDNTSRHAFDNWATHHATTRAIAEMDLARVKSARQLPAPVRALLAAAARHLMPALAHSA